MPASTRRSVLLPAPLWPITPMRSPWLTVIVTSWSALTSMTGLLALRNILPMRNSFRVSRVFLRTRKVRPTPCSSIRAMSLDPSQHTPGGGGRRRSQVENQPPLVGPQREAGRRRQDQGDGGGGAVGRHAGDAAVD